MPENAQSAEVLAKLLDITERRVRQLSAEGIIPKVARGRRGNGTRTGPSISAVSWMRSQMPL